MKIKGYTRSNGVKVKSHNRQVKKRKVIPNSKKLHNPKTKRLSKSYHKKRYEEVAKFIKNLRKGLKDKTRTKREKAYSAALLKRHIKENSQLKKHLKSL